MLYVVTAESGDWTFRGRNAHPCRRMDTATRLASLAGWTSFFPGALPSRTGHGSVVRFGPVLGKRAQTVRPGLTGVKEIRRLAIAQNPRRPATPTCRATRSRPSGRSRASGGRDARTDRGLSLPSATARLDTGGGDRFPRRKRSAARDHLAAAGPDGHDFANYKPGTLLAASSAGSCAGQSSLTAYAQVMREQPQEASGADEGISSSA
jgi:hypothetical protein